MSYSKNFTSLYSYELFLFMIFFITLYSFLKMWTHWYYNTTCDITSEANVWCISISLPYLNQLYPLSCFNHRELHGLIRMQKYTKDYLFMLEKTFNCSFTNMLGEFNTLVMFVSMRHRILSPLRALRQLSFIFETKKWIKKPEKQTYHTPPQKRKF